MSSINPGGPPPGPSGMGKLKLYVYENKRSLDLEPLVLTRPSFDLRYGAHTFLERLQYLFPQADISLFLRPELAPLARETYPGLAVNPRQVEQGIWLLGSVFWQEEEVRRIATGPDRCYFQEGTLVAASLSREGGREWLRQGGPVAVDLEMDLPAEELSSPAVGYLWDLLQRIPLNLELDRNHYQTGSLGERALPGVELVNPAGIHIAEPERIRPAVVVDASRGPVIVEAEVEILPFTYIQGPAFIGRGTIIQPHTQIRHSVIGPVCRLGGEVSGTIIQGFSNKAHGGYLGDAFLGQWVNLGAGTHNSNLKNNYSTVRVSVNGEQVDTGSRHVGCFIGDHCRTAIGTLLNTGAVLGPGCMLAADGLAPKTLPPFTWYVNGQHSLTRWEAFIETARTVESRRGLDLSPAEEQRLKQIHTQAKR